ncbi:hypothetical protein R3P38DRAFT_1966666 [Favolaschia claudopus]|uniref:F-box domain-containing protein n=1 Tax=Favolaschia claudopus TaxID=2862362 RepID=A0AAV9ZZR2_9AGAR
MTTLYWTIPPRPPSPVSFTVDVTPLLRNNDVPRDFEIPYIHDILSTGQSEVDDLNIQIGHVVVALARLVRKRDITVENIRQHRAVLSPVRRLPAELVCEIGLLSVTHDRRPPWRLAKICRSWRHFLLGNSGLWTDIHIPSSGRGPDLHRMFQTLLARSGSAPLNVCWAPRSALCRYLPIDVDVPDADCVRSVVAQCPRWRSLRLDFTAGIGLLRWLSMTSGNLGALQICEVIEIEKERHELPASRSLLKDSSWSKEVEAGLEAVFSSPSNLRNISISNWRHAVFPPDFTPNWTQLTHYSGPITREQLEMLAHAPLVYLAVRSGGSTGPKPESKASALLSSLRHLCVQEPYILLHIQAPSLEVLTCHRQHATSSPHVLAFVKAYGNSLRKLVLRQSDTPGLVPVLECLPNLTHLLIEDHGDAPDAALFRALETSSLCPKLSTFVYGSRTTFDAFSLCSMSDFSSAAIRIALEPCLVLPPTRRKNFFSHFAKQWHCCRRRSFGFDTAQQPLMRVLHPLFLGRLCVVLHLVDCKELAAFAIS